MNGTTTAINIVTLSEYEGGPIGWYANGHHEPEAFCRAIIENDEHWGAGDPIPMPADVRHSWQRNVPVGRGIHAVCMHPARPGKQGAYEITSVEWADIRDRERQAGGAA